MFSSERLKGIDVFVATVDAGSFTAAAERLNLTSSAVGKSVARLEARLGVRLLERTTRSLSLTDAGEAFHQTCLRVLEDLEEAEQVLKTEGTVPAGKLRIDLPATYGRKKVLPALFRFLKRYPGVYPQVSFTDRFVDLAEDGIDVSVRIGADESWPATLGHRFLGRERRVFCCSPGFLETHGKPESLDALLAQQAVLYRRADGTASPWFILRNGMSVEQFHPQARVEIGNAEAVVESVLHGLGVAQMSTWVIEDQLASGELVELMPSLAIDGLPLHLVWLRSRQLLPKVDALINHLAAELQL